MSVKKKKKNRQLNTDKGAIIGAGTGTVLGLAKGGAIGIASFGGAIGLPLVVAGAVVGLGVGWTATYAFNKMKKKKS